MKTECRVIRWHFYASKVRCTLCAECIVDAQQFPLSLYTHTHTHVHIRVRACIMFDQWLTFCVPLIACGIAAVMCNYETRCSHNNYNIAFVFMRSRRLAHSHPRVCVCVCVRWCARVVRVPQCVRRAKILMSICVLRPDSADLAP